MFIRQTDNASKAAPAADCAFSPLNDTLLTNFPLLTLTHPILKKQHNDFITQAPEDGDS